MIVKLKKCSDSDVTIWITGEAGDWTAGTYSITVVGKVVKLSNYSGSVAPGTTNFSPSASNVKLGIAGSSYSLNSDDCWQILQIEDPTSYDDPADPDGPWITDGGIVVNGFTQEAGYNTCDGCSGGGVVDDCVTPTATTECGKDTTTGCQKKDCDCNTTELCAATPPDCDEPCDADCSCEEVVISHCVVYNGPKIECLGINPGMTMNQVVALIGSNLCNADIETTCSDVECSNNLDNCSSPLDLIFKPFYDELAEADLSDTTDIQVFIQTYFDTLWENGIIRTNDCTNPVCCQECCEDDFYLLAGAQLAFAFFELTEYPSCCVNSSFGSDIAIQGGAGNILNPDITTTINDVIQIWEDENPNLADGDLPPTSIPVLVGGPHHPNPLIFGNTKQCCTDGTFAECLDNLYDLVDLEPSIVDSGIVESQYANNGSLVCGLAAYLEDESMVTLSLASRLQILEYFIEKGFVVSCCNSQIFIGSVETFYSLIVEGTIESCIKDKIAPTFDFGPYCLNAVEALPATTSLEGITGSWVETTVNTSVLGTSNYLTFIPDSGQNAYNVSVGYEVVQLVVNDLTPTACGNTPTETHPIDLTALNAAISTDGVTFTWYEDVLLTTEIVDPTAAIITIGGAQTVYCEVTDVNGCQDISTVVYTVLPAALFTPIVGGNAPNCDWAFEIGEVAPALPAPNNGITGTWSPATIDTTSAGVFDYTFTPDNGCPDIVQSIVIYDPLSPPC